MAGTAKVFFANRLTLTINDGTTEHPLAVLHGCEIIPQAEHIEEYGMDSIFRESVAKVKFKVDFKVKYAKFNPVVTEWWMMRVWNPAAGDGTVADTNDVALFSATGEISDGGTTPQILQAMIEDIYFPATPLILAENQFIVHDLSGVGRMIGYSNPVAAP